jgi:pimeloyl-ACP methyl ester carboxylesterase
MKFLETKLGSLLRNKKVLAGLALLGVVGLLLAQFVLRPYVYKLRSGVREIDIPGAAIAYRDLGKGSPVVVIVSGMACAMDGYHVLQKSLSDVTRVIAYDRPGLGFSEPNVDSRKLDVIDRDMKNVLKALDAPPPYVLIGHSLGGHIIRYYADKHPGEVAGLVFIDHPHEDWFRYIRKTWTPEESKNYFKWWAPDNEGFTGVPLEEMLTYENNCDMVRGIKIDPDISALMFTGNNYGHFRKSSPGKDLDREQWASMQGSLLEGVKDARHIVDWDAGHMLHKDKPEIVEREIEKFVLHLREKAKATSSAQRDAAGAVATPR